VTGYFLAAEVPSREASLSALKRFLPPDASLGVLSRTTVAVEHKPWHDWAGESRRTWRATQVTPRLWIAPPWDRDSLPRDAAEFLIIEPGAAFGVGTHATTRGCLQAIEAWAAGTAERGTAEPGAAEPATAEPATAEPGTVEPGTVEQGTVEPGTVEPVAAEPATVEPRALDVGTGTGVLALRAAQFGARPVIAFDNDPLAAAAAQHNARLNQLAEQVHVFTGTLAALRPRARFELVLANLLLNPLLALAPRIATHLQPGGTLIASGVRVEDRAELEAAFAAHGCHPTGLYAADDWATVILRREWASPLAARPGILRKRS